jgi:hypothetical protein
MDRKQEELARQEKQAKFPAATSYQLKLTMNHESGPGGATADIQQILLEELHASLGQTGVNPKDGANQGDGDLGEIVIELTAEQAKYQEGGQAIEIPTSFEATMNVSSKGGKSTWDGTHALKANKAAPTSVQSNGATYIREGQIRDLVQSMLEGLPEFER